MSAAAPIAPITDRALDEAARLIRAGRLVAFPTETVYGLGADAANDRAVAQIFAAKQRPQFNPLIVHAPDAGAVRAQARFDGRAERLAGRFWPGALTLVLPRRAGAALAPLVSAGLDTVAARVPAHPVAHRLLALSDRLIAAPSANRSGRVSPTTARHVVEELGPAVDLILDGGACPIGLESTIVDLTGPEAALLRPGGVPVEDIEAEIGPLARGDRGPVRAPGMGEGHYAPATRLRLNARQVAGDEALLAFGPDCPRGAAKTANLSPSRDLVEAAANLFAMLRDLDREGYSAIAVSPIPRTGLGLAINDRLRRAAAREG